MSTLLAYLKLPNNKGVIWWVKFYWNEFLKAIYEKKVSNKIDKSWVGIKTQSTYKPSFYPKNPNINNVTLYLEVFGNKNLWKRK
jgi:hypothetical protein